MASQRRKNNPGNQYVNKQLGTPVDDQPWNKSQMEIEPMPAPGPSPGAQPQGQFHDRLKIAPMNEEGAANKRAVRGWPEGQKKA